MDSSAGAILPITYYIIDFYRNTQSYVSITK